MQGPYRELFPITMDCMRIPNKNMHTDIRAKIQFSLQTTCLLLFFLPDDLMIAMIGGNLQGGSSVYVKEALNAAMNFRSQKVITVEELSLKMAYYRKVIRRKSVNDRSVWSKRWLDVWEAQRK